MTNHVRFLNIFSAPCFNSINALSNPQIHATNIEMKNPPTGSKTFDAIKSTMSKNVLPLYVKSANKLNDNALGMPNKNTNEPNIKTA